MRTIKLKKPTPVSTFLYKVEGGWRVLGIMPEQAAKSMAYTNALQIRAIEYTKHMSDRVKIFLED